MPTPPLTDEVIRDTLALVEQYGSVYGAVQATGIPRSTFQNRLRTAKKRGLSASRPADELRFTAAPEHDETVEELLARKRQLFERKRAHHNFHKLVPVQVRHSGPIAVTLIGDPHIDDDGCDIIALERDLEIIQQTPGMYAGHVGDLTNNWVGRLARLYANQTTTATQAIKLMEWMLGRARTLFLVGGNHDCWNQGMDLINFIMRQHQGVVQPHGVRLALNFESGKQIRIHARHDFPGHSQFNPNHGHRKQQLWSGNRDHVLVSGHRHVDGATVIPQSDGTCSWSFIVSGYKVIDDYAESHGFHEQRMAPSVTIIVNPNARTEAETIKPYWDAAAAADYLNFIRKRSS